MTDDKTTAEMLQRVLDALKKNRMHPSFDADVMNVSERAKNIRDAAIRGPIEKQCEELLLAPQPDPPDILGTGL